MSQLLGIEPDWYDVVSFPHAVTYLPFSCLRESHCFQYPCGICKEMEASRAIAALVI